MWEIESREWEREREGDVTRMSTSICSQAITYIRTKNYRKDAHCSLVKGIFTKKIWDILNKSRGNHVHP